MNKRKAFETAVEICRIILGLVFIFSGFMKCVDPWGTSVKLQEYFAAFGTEWLSGLSPVMAVALCTVELAVGLMLLFGVMIRLASVAAFIFMAFFTILTLAIAIWDPLSDCGCLGSAIRLENWHTFYKNLILFPLSALLVWRHRKDKALRFSQKQFWLTLLFIGAGLALSIYSWRYLPAIDMLPYKVGVNLRTDVKCWRCEDKGLKLVYRDRITGDEAEFAISDTTWYDSERWEYVTTKNFYHDNPPKITAYDFALWRNGYNLVDEVIYRDGTVHMICFQELGEMPEACRKRIDDYVRKLVARGEYVIAVSGIDPAAETVHKAEIELGGGMVPHYGMESALLKTLLRADAGMVVIRDGVIIDKRSCWEMKYIPRTMHLQSQTVGVVTILMPF